jgi:hypothetical protein
MAIAAQPGAPYFPVGHNFLHHSPVSAGMIRLPQMAEFMDDHIVDDLLRSHYYSPVEIDSAVSVAAAPSGRIVLDGNKLRLEVITAAQQK